MSITAVWGRGMEKVISFGHLALLRVLTDLGSQDCYEHFTSLEFRAERDLLD